MADDLQILKDWLGRPVRLTQERRAHILQHPEMAQMETEILAAVADPEPVIRASEDVLLSYRFERQTIWATSGFALR